MFLPGAACYAKPAYAERQMAMSFVLGSAFVDIAMAIQWAIPLVVGGFGLRQCCWSGHDF